MAITKQAVSNAALGSYQVGVFRLANGTELQGVVLVDSTGAELAALPVGFTAPTNSTSTALEASRIIKATAGTLFVVSGFNNSASDQFIQLFDSATVPLNTAVPKIVIRAIAGEPFGYRAPDAGRAFTTGIVICNSSTGPTKTLGSADCLFDVQYS